MSNYECDRALMEGARNAACDGYFAARPQIDSIDRRRVYEAAFQAGAASRDAEVAQWQKIIDEEAKDSALVIIERDQLSAQINVLREALSKMHDTYFKTDEDEELCKRALASTPAQSLAEYRNKVIEAFVNEFTRHVGGDGEFWLHELQDFAMKEQP